MVKESLLNFFKKESSTGILLMLATVLAMVAANTPFKSFYNEFSQIPVVVSIGTFSIAKPLLLWINDGLMAVFFFMVGMEIKREVVEGELAKPSHIALPAFAAVGGMVLPSLIYILFNYHDPHAMKGWAIPSATDIAFALGILSLLGKRVPTTLKLFLLTLAIIDDLGAIAVIALFYTSKISFTALVIAGTALLLLFFINKKGVVNNTLYFLVGTILWTALLKSGVHATLAGVITALFIPVRNNKASFHNLESSLYAPVNHIILPLFAFVNTGIDFGTTRLGDLFHPITLGIVLGLFLGKQIGIFLFGWLAVRFEWGALPQGVTWRHIYGAALLGGIGFTMSLFIGSLAFECTGEACLLQTDERIGILLGSLISGVAGYLYLRYFTPASR